MKRSKKYDIIILFRMRELIVICIIKKYKNINRVIDTTKTWWTPERHISDVLFIIWSRKNPHSDFIKQQNYNIRSASAASMVQ